MHDDSYYTAINRRLYSTGYFPLACEGLTFLTPFYRILVACRKSKAEKKNENNGKIILYLLFIILNACVLEHFISSVKLSDRYLMQGIFFLMFKRQLKLWLKNRRDKRKVKQKLKRYIRNEIENTEEKIKKKKKEEANKQIKRRSERKKMNEIIEGM